MQELRDNGIEVRALYRHQYRENTLSEYDIRTTKYPGSWFARKFWGEQAFVRIEWLIVKGNFDNIEVMQLPRIKGLRRLSVESPCLTDLSGLSVIKDLKELEISSSRLIRSENLKCLSGIDSLEKLTIVDCDNFTKLDSLATSKIVRLVIVNCGIDEFDGSCFPCLETVTLFDNEKLQTLKCTNLSLHLSGVRIENCAEVVLVEIACAQKLQHVWIADCSKLKKIVLKDLPGLSSFEADECDALKTVVGLEDLSSDQMYVSGCPNLETLAGRLRD